MPRLQIDVTEAKLKTMAELMGLCNLQTKKDLFNNALTLFQWAVEEKRQGNTIASINENTKNYRELQMPALSEVPVAKSKWAAAS